MLFILISYKTEEQPAAKEFKKTIMISIFKAQEEQSSI